MPNTVAQDVDVDRVALPAQGSSVRPVDVLSDGPCPARAHVCRGLRRLEEPLPAWLNPTLRPCHRIDPEAEFQLARRLIGCDMACLLEESEIPVGPDGRPLVGGWFAVDHSRGRQRLIFDRRPQNSTETLLSSWIDLRSGTQLIHLIMDPGDCVRGSGEDLECYFYQFAHEPNWYTKKAVGRVFDGDRFRDLGTQRGKRYQLCLKVVAMGDVNGVTIAQQVHEAILISNGAPNNNNVVRFSGITPASDTWEMLSGRFQRRLRSSECAP